MLRRSIGVLVALVLLALAAACGGQGGDKRSVEPAEPTFSPSSTAYVPAVTRPNVLVIETDDMRSDELQFMPNVRKLIGQRGITFENSFAPYPLCCPSRATFLSGQYNHNNGVLSVKKPWGFQAFDDTTTIATVLQKAGYNTALVGKYLNGYGSEHRHDSTLSSRTYVAPGWTDWYAGSDHRYGSKSPLFGGTYNYFHYTQVINGKVVAHPDRYSTDVNASETRGRIRAYGKQKKPWFIWWTPTAPHFGRPHEKDDPAPLRDTKGKLERWPTPARPGWVRGIFDKKITHPLGTPPYGPAEADISDKPRLLSGTPEMDDAERKALTEVERQRAESLYVLDRQIGVTMKTLQRTGQWDNTVVVFTSDNGYFLGEHRKRQGKILAHEPSLRVPLLIAGPGIEHGQRYDPVSVIDMAPTLAQYAGTTMPDTDGTSFLRDLEQGDTGWTVPVVTEGRDDRKSYVRARSPGFESNGLDTRGLRLGRWSYIRYSTGETELYDLAKDPLQLSSEQDNPAYAGISRQLAALWTKYMNCKGADCQDPLPAKFRLTPAQEKAITDDEITRTNVYYDDHWTR
ncbi:hypothetical protein D9V37_15560 [Nocardioides mangrovicus]|uniref:Sulfatase N-terminal domain-containing protein n=1 Tax=Nocardioides mangrovicus TaxID=2478913 RepID=A0A3L8NYF5_9ACTN|nr:sulfatase [Nocardioides mangrovicus]RLV47583.1 hypothetical protein D9V37_15560 [Nocardioides mangrovicus]